MPRELSFWCQKILHCWQSATLQDYLFAVAWVVLIGYLISKMSSFSTR